MAFTHLTTSANPELRKYVRRARMERAHAVHAAHKAIARALFAPVGRFVDAVRRARRARRTYSELSALSDRQLKDIGLARGEITSLARAAAAEPPEVRLTLAELRQTRSPVSLGREARVVQLASAGRRRRKSDLGSARRAGAESAKYKRATA